MRTFRIGLYIFGILSLIMTQADLHLVYAADEEHEGHRHGSHEQTQEVEEHEEQEESHEEHAEDSHKDHEESDNSHNDHNDHDDHGDEPDSHEGHDDHGDEGVISLDEEARSMIQLETEKVVKSNLGGHLKVYGKIAKDTENTSYVAFDGEGKIAALKVNLGDIVDQGEELFTVEKKDGTTETIVSEMHGTILSIFVKTGDRIDSLKSVLSIIDVDTLRATIDIYERDLQLVRVGQKVLLTTAAYPNEEFKGEVVYISPQVDEHTQAIKVRVDIDNPEHLLRLGMFVSGELIYTSDKKVLAIPSSAVQQLNEEDIVFVAQEGNDLKVREVVLGRSVNDYVEVRKGLNEGEMVVTQGSFYIKSEQAKEAFGDGHNH